MKRFSNGRGFWCLGGKGGENYREKSVDVAGYARRTRCFDEDIEKEGSPTFRVINVLRGLSGSKSIRGSTPKQRGPARLSVLPASPGISCVFMFLSALW